MSDKDSRLQAKSPVPMASLKGKLLFAASHVFGERAQVAIQLINNDGDADGRQSAIRAAERALTALRVSGPRVVQAWSQQPPTQGACEQEGNLVTRGAVLFDPVTKTSQFFGDRIPDRFAALWKATGRSQLIFYAVIFPILIAKKTWAGLLRNRRVLLWVDNEVALAAVIRCYSPL